MGIIDKVIKVIEKIEILGMQNMHSLKLIVEK